MPASEDRGAFRYVVGREIPLTEVTLETENSAAGIIPTTERIDFRPLTELAKFAWWIAELVVA